MDFYTFPGMGRKDGIYRHEGKDNTDSSFTTNNLFHSALAKKQVIKMKLFKYLISLIKPILITSNLIVFSTFIVTGLIMYRLGNRDIALILFFAAFLYILFNKIESMDRRIKELGEE